MGKDDPTQQRMGDSDDLGVTFLSRKGDAEKATALGKPVSVPSPNQNAESLFNVTRAFEQNEPEVGTIISDKRRERPSFGALIGGAFTEWWGKTRKGVEDTYKRVDELAREAEAPKIAPAEERKDTIIAASKLAEQAPHDDHKIIVEKFKTLSHDAENITGKPYSIKPVVSEHDRTWDHTVEPEEGEGKKSSGSSSESRKNIETIDLRKASIAPNIGTRVATAPESYTAFDRPKPIPAKPEPVVVPGIPAKPLEIERKGGFSVAPSVASRVSGTLRPHTPLPPISPRLPRVESQPPAPAPQKELIIPPLKEEKAEQTTEVIPRVEQTTEVIPTVEQTTEVIPRVKGSAYLSPLLEAEDALYVDEYEQPEKEPLEDSPPSVAPSTQTSEDLNNEPNILVLLLNSRLFVIGIAVIIAGVLGVGTAIYVMTRPKNETQQTNQLVQASGVVLLASNTVTNVPLGNDAGTFLKAALGIVVGNNTGVTQILPTMHEAPAAINDVVTALHPRADGTFLRSLDAMMFGGIMLNTNEPFLMLRTTTYELALSGMLSWEPTVSTDLSPYFGAPVTSTLVPSKEAPAANPHFTDTAKNGHRYRVLYDAAGKERIAYSIVNTRVIVIAGSVDAVSSIIERMK